MPLPASLRTNIDLLIQTQRQPDRLLPRDTHDLLLADVKSQLTDLTTLVGDLAEPAWDDEAQPVARRCGWACGPPSRAHKAPHVFARFYRSAVARAVIGDSFDLMCFSCSSRRVLNLCA